MIINLLKLREHRQKQWMDGKKIIEVISFPPETERDSVN